MFTHQINLPLNYYTESWDPLALPADWATTRDSWNQANAARVLNSFIAFLLSLCALVLQPNRTDKTELTENKGFE